MASRSARSTASRRVTSPRSEEHTSELQSQSNLVCRLLLEKKNNAVRNLARAAQRHHALAQRHTPHLLQPAEHRLPVSARRLLRPRPRLDAHHVLTTAIALY